MEYRILKENEIKEAIELVARVAKKDIYKDFDQEGINSFNQVNCDTFYRNKQNLTYICLENKKIIGIITLTQGKHLSLLFVDNDYQGNGIGTKLFELIDEAHLDNKDVWKRANLDRKHFSKIQCDQNYHPKKKTVMALCIALQLDLEQSKDLLARADWAFSPSSKVDLIVQKAIIDKQYDIMQLNVTLFKYTNEILGV